MANIVLGVSGSIAAYRAADLARELMRAGHDVRVCLTDGAQQFVTPILFETLTGNPCLQDTFEEPERGRMAHLDWARQADLLLIAPATANTINRIANGIGEDMLTTIALAFERQIVIAPAMNPAMYQHPETQSSLAKLSDRGAFIIEPSEGDVVAGEHGQGKLASNAEILDSVSSLLIQSRAWQGKRVVITSGPTQEPIDSVRFLTNRSSGKMGAALAQAAWQMGAEVTVIAGPSQVSYPRNVQIIQVRTAVEMREKALAAAIGADLAIGAAAVADYRPVNPRSDKIRRSAEHIQLELVPNPDIIAELAKVAKRTVGFAAEPSNDLTIAREKVARKGLFAIAHNDVSNPEIGFETDRNQLTLLFADGRMETSPIQSKLRCAIWLLARLALQ